MNSSTTTPVTPLATETLVEVLNDTLRVLCPGRRVADVSRRPALYYSSHRMEDLFVRLDDETGLELVLKELEPIRFTDGADPVKPKFLYNPAREFSAYDILFAWSIDAPRCLDFHYESSSRRTFLLLKKAPGVPLWQVGDFAAWQAAARWAATMHARLADVVHLNKPGALLAYDRTFFEAWPRRVRRFLLDRAGEAVGMRRLARLLDGYESVVKRLLRLPTTMVHGEFCASNILVDRTSEGPRVLPVDWEMAGVGPGLMDLADLTAGKWSEVERRSLVDAYRQALPLGAAPAAEEFEAALDACRLHKAMQWLGWAERWEPPKEHRQDWLGEALRLGEKLKLI